MLRLDISNVDRVETNIRPLMGLAVTIPVHEDGLPTGVAVHVVAAGQGGWHRNDAEAIVVEVAQRLALVPKEDA